MRLRPLKPGKSLTFARLLPFLRRASIVNQNGFNQIRLNFSGLGCWLVVLGGIWLLGAVGLGWVVKSIAVIAVLVMLAPVLIFLGLRFWLKRNLIQADCPVCSTGLTGVKGAETLCPNCGTPLKVDAEGFKRLTQEGTIDVSAVDVTVEVVPDDQPILPGDAE
jgi:hypothetical protein